VVYFDEAQHLSPSCLETVRELFDELKWSLCFAGSHNLDDVFIRFAGELEQLDSRVIEKVYLPSLTQEEATGIIRSEMAGLDGAEIRTLIEASTVVIRVKKKQQRYISIRRIMETLHELQDTCPDRVDGGATPSEEVQ
jgi:DNA transposition AAA+ family ATPase